MPRQDEFTHTLVGEVCDVQTGPFGSQLHAEDYKSEGTPIITVEHLGDNAVIANDVPLVGEADCSRLARYTLRRGDVVFSRVGAIDRRAYITEREDGWLFSGRCLRVRPTSELVDSRYLSYVFGLPRTTSWILNHSVGSTMACLNTSILAGTPLALPPVAQQRRIAEILDTADEAIRGTEALVGKLKAMKAGLLDDLLTRGLDEHGHLRDPATHPEQFKDSPLGRVPNEWEVLTLERVSTTLITYGIVQPGPHIPGGVPFIQTKDLTAGKLHRASMDCTSVAIAGSYRRSAVKAGEIVCGIRATVGSVLEVPEELEGANISRGVARIAPGAECSGRYVLWALRSRRVQDAIQSSVKGTTYAEITLPALRATLIPVPQRREQEQLVEVLDAHDARIRAEEAYLDKLKLQKKGLMHDLLTGRVRVSKTIESRRMRMSSSLEIPQGLTPEAQRARETFRCELEELRARSRQVAFNVLVWGQGPDCDTALAVKRREIREQLIADGHNAMFSEEIVGGIEGLHSMKSQEYVQAQAADLIVVLVEDSAGALAEAHDFADHPDLAQKVLVMAPTKYEEGYSSHGLLSDLAEAYGAVYWYQEDGISSCRVLDRARRFVEARRQIAYRHRPASSD